MATWRRKIMAEMAQHGESFDDVVESTLSDAELDTDFDDDFGSTEGEPFTLWTRNRVYFPTEYDGAEGVASVARNPDGVRTDHV